MSLNLLWIVAWHMVGRLISPRNNEAVMNKILILVFSLLFCGCADYSTNASVNGVRGPNDLVPQPFPDPKPDPNASR